MRRKTDTERRDNVVRFRLNVGERKQLTRITRDAGLSISKLFRLKVLGVPTRLPLSDAEKKAIADSTAISNRTDISDAQKKKLNRAAQVKRIAEKHSEHEKVKRYRRNRSA